jgi:hypothetical protein
MAKYRKKSTIVEAEQWFKLGDVEGVVELQNYGQLSDDCRECEIWETPNYEDIHLDGESHGWIKGTRDCPSSNHVLPDSEEGQLVCPGDYIAIDELGKKHIIKPSIFENHYERVKNGC